MALSDRHSIIWEKRIPVFFIGITTSIIVSIYFEGSLNYIFYAITALIGYLTISQKNALINGLLYAIGYSISFWVMLIRETGSLAYSMSFGIGITIIGAVLGIALAYIGYSLRVIIRKK